LCKKTFSFELVVGPLALVNFAIIPGADSLPIHLVMSPLAVIQHAIISDIFPWAMFFTLNKLSFIAAADSVFNGAMSIEESVLELSIVLIPIVENKSAMAMKLAIFPHAIILAIIGAILSAFAVFDVHFF
jgi:hypothetical protein